MPQSGWRVLGTGLNHSESTWSRLRARGQPLNRVLEGWTGSHTSTPRYVARKRCQKVLQRGRLLRLDGSRRFCFSWRVPRLSSGLGQCHKKARYAIPAATIREAITPTLPAQLASTVSIFVCSSRPILFGLPLHRRAAGFFVLSQSDERPQTRSLYVSVALRPLAIKGLTTC
jgi:hypothetical protein